MADVEGKTELPPPKEHPEDADENHAEEEDTGANIAPLVKLDAVEISTGEENEETLFEIKAKLYRYDSDGQQWKERGVGQVKLLQHKQSSRIRLLMRQAKTLKICANHAVHPSISLQEHQGNEKSLVWHASDFADGELKQENFAMRFGSVESAQKFRAAFEEAQEKMEKIIGSSISEESKEKADIVADSLKDLKVDPEKKD